MELPTIPHVLTDAPRNTRYVVLAYRQLSDSEVVAAVRFYLMHNKRPKKNTELTITTTIGARD